MSALEIASLIGTIVFAASGAMLSVRKGFDLLSVIVLGCVTAVGYRLYSRHNRLFCELEGSVCFVFANHQSIWDYATRVSKAWAGSLSGALLHYRIAAP
jgi:hypothetical protein